MNTFLRMDEVLGDVETEGHLNEIAVFAWAWGMTSTYSHVHEEPTRIDVQDIAITKFMDDASVKLLSLCAASERTATAELVSESNGKPIFTLALRDIVVTSISTGGSSGEERTMETIMLNFAGFEFTYHFNDEKDTNRTMSTMRYDVASCVPLDLA